MLRNKKTPLKSDKTPTIRGHKRGVVGYSKKTALLEEAITQMNAGKYGRSSAALKELLALDPNNMEARRLFATLHLRLGSLIPARQAFDSLISEAFQRQDYWLAESLLREYLAAGPRCVPFLEKLGTLYQEKGDALEAVAEYGKAIDILIEDPDSDNPNHASQLYAKIRELAPASPIAIRLASFFDAQTGELLARQPSDAGQSTVSLSLDMPEEGQGIQAAPEPMDGVMPWEIQDAQGMAPDALKAADVSDSSGSLISPMIADVPGHQESSFDEKSVPSDSLLREPAAKSASEDRGDASEETRTPEFGSAPSEAQMDDHFAQVILEASHPALPSEPAAESSAIQPVLDSAVSISGPVAVQEQEGLLAEAEPEALHDASGPSIVFSPQLAADSLESPISSAQFIAAPLPHGTESSAIQSGSDPAASKGDTAQEQDSLLSAESESKTSSDVSPSMVPVPTELTNASESAGSVQSIEDDGIAPLFKIEEISPPTFLGTKLLTAEPIKAEDRPLFLQQPVEINSKEPVTELPPDTPDPANPNPESVSADEISEPWKKPGFSWESLFNSAWKFGSDHSAQVSPPEITKTNVEDASPPASAASPPPEQALENQAIEIPAREASMSFGDQTPSGSPIAPMPWDQVQESVISILPKQADQPGEDNAESTVDRTIDEINPDESLRVDEAQAQPPPPPDISVAGMESFSIAQTTEEPISTEPEISVVDTEQSSFTAERTSTLTEPEPQFRIVSAPTMDEPPSLVAPMEEIASPPVENKPVPEDVVVPADFTLQSADPVLSTGDDHTIPADQGCGQEPVVETSVDSSQPTGETLNGETNEIPLSPPLPKQQRIYEPQPEIVATPRLAEETTEVRTHKHQPQATAFVEERPPIPEPAPEPVPEEKWSEAGNSIRFIEPSQAPPIVHVPPAISERQEVSRSVSAAAAAVDVLFESSRNVKATEIRESVAESKPRRKSSFTLARIRMAIAGFVGSCFSTTRAMVVTCIGLVMLSGILIALGISAIGLTWIIMEESPSPVFQSFTTTPQRILSDLKKNGYFLLLGIDAPEGYDPIQAGYDRKPEMNNGHSGNLAVACFGGPESKTIQGSSASADVMRGWIRSSNPVGEFKSHQDTIKRWGNEHQPMLSRYSQWQKLPFEDWGYGQLVGPPCTVMAFAHQLHVADGFLQGPDLGVDRLDTDMEAWRIVLSQARTLAVKMLALQAINDDIAVASGLLISPDFDGKYLGRVTKLLRPLDQTELSLRWPMQSELVVASKMYDAQLKVARAEEQPLYTMVASALPLPKQRRLNDYADYYDASYKAAGEGKYGSLPKWKSYIHFPASGLMDYFTNPIENIAGLEPLPPWDRYNGFVVDTDARLRLAGLQAWLRRGPADAELLTRIAKAGQNFYDPYTGLPMLVNMKKGVLYSVGHDGKDQDADPLSDVVVEIPAGYTSAAQAKPATASSKSR